MHAESLNTNTGETMAGPLLCKPKVWGDDRGFFFESWNYRTWKDILNTYEQEFDEFVQDNHSRSSKGVLRGMHYQLSPNPQAKLVRCVLGEIFDVAVDIRLGSPTFGSWVGSFLSGKNCFQLWLPVGFAHGFLTLSDHAEVLYKTTDFWSRDCEQSIRWDDPDIGIDWPLERLEDMKIQLSPKDAEAGLLMQLKEEDLFL